MKLLKRKNFQALIYAIFISLPMLSILPSTIYFAFNHEASNYTHDEVITTYEYETNEVNSFNDLVEGNIYHFELTNYQINANEYFRIVHKGCYNIVYDEELPIIGTTQNAPILNISNGLFIYTLTDTFISSSYPGFRTSQQYLELDFKCDFVYQLMDIDNGNFIQYISASDYLGEKNVEVIESEMNPLSAFDNAIGKFVSDNDFGNLDFFTFFSSLFLTSTSMNNLYIHFINWYMNYALYVSLAYLLFGVLLYFVNFFRKLVENSEDTHIGGF